MSRPLSFDEIENKTITLPVLVACPHWDGVNVEVVRDYERLNDLMMIYEGVVNILIENTKEIYI